MEVSWLYLIPLLPLAGAAINGILGRWLPKAWVYAVALLVVALSFCIGLFGWLQMARIEGETAQVRQLVYTWFTTGSLRVDLGLTLDRLSVFPCVTVCGVLELDSDDPSADNDLVVVVHEVEVYPRTQVFRSLLQPDP